MALSTYGTNHALAVRFWAKKLAAEALRKTFFADLIGRSTDSVIVRRDEMGIIGGGVRIWCIVDGPESRGCGAGANQKTAIAPLTSARHRSPFVGQHVPFIESALVITPVIPDKITRVIMSRERTWQSGSAKANRW